MINFVLQALDGIFTIVFVVGIGYVLSKKGWFDDKSSALIAKLVTTVSLPLYMITSLTKNFTAEKLVELARSEEALPRGSVSIAKTDFIDRLTAGVPSFLSPPRKLLRSPSGRGLSPALGLMTT